MKQCRLVRGNESLVTWLPNSYASKDRLVRIKEDGVWSTGWTVAWVSQDEAEESSLPDAHEYRKAVRARRKQ